MATFDRILLVSPIRICDTDLTDPATTPIPPPRVRQCEITEGGAITLTKADPHELQRKANKFRQGYKNWRQKKPRGAWMRGFDHECERLASLVNLLVTNEPHMCAFIVCQSNHTEQARAVRRRS